MAKTRIAESYVQVIATTEGISKAIAEAVGQGYKEAEKEAEKSSEEAGEESGKKAGKGMAAGLAVAGAAIAAVLAKTFSTAMNDAMESAGQQAKLEAKLNLSVGESKEAKKAIDDLYRGAYGEDKAQVSEAVGSIMSTIKGARSASSSELQKMGRDVLNLSSIWGVESKEITRAATTMINSGMASNWNDAISTITGGMQTMGEKGEDWLDTLNEYSDDFKKFGLTGKSAINFVNAALDVGAFNTDKVADALNELSITLTDGSIDDDIKSLGMNPDDIRKRIAEGGDAAQGALLEVLTRLQKSGKTDKFQKFMSSMGEDFKDNFQNMDLSKLNADLEEGVGNMEKLDKTVNDTAETGLVALQREWAGAFEDTIVPILQAITPHLISFAEWVNKNRWFLGALATVLGIVLVTALIASSIALIGFAKAGWAALAPFLPMIGTVLLVVTAVAAVIAIVWLLWANWDAIWSWMTSAAKATGDWFVGIWNGISEWWVDLWGGISSFFVDTWNGIADFFIGLWTSVVDFFVGIYETIMSIIDSIFGAESPVGKGINLFFQTGSYLGGLGVPAMADGGTIPAKSGGTLALLGEAGRSEVVMDSGKWNRLLDNINSGKVGTGGNSSVTFNITQKENESTEDLVNKINEYLDFTGLR